MRNPTSDDDEDTTPETTEPEGEGGAENEENEADTRPESERLANAERP